MDESIFEKQELGGISRYFCELAQAISDHSEHRVMIDEGIGLPRLQAMQAHCPSIAQKVSSIPEVLGDCGHYMDSPSSEALLAQMKQLLQWNTQPTTSERANLRTQQLEQFSWFKTAQKNDLDLPTPVT